MAISEAMVKQGRVLGCVQDGYTVFRGIPYAKPPVGELRFEPPMEAESYEGGVWNADHFPPIAMQHFREFGDKLYTKEFYSNPDFLFPHSEDCLYLNVWTPAEKTEEKLPVAMWIHGGGLEHGYAAELEFDGEAYAKKGVILVTVAYRVGVFGFLYSREQERKNGHSGNQGFLDQIAALKWIRENIAAFGGDPENITVFGQSAGAISTQTLVLSPLSSGLVSRAILQSAGGISRLVSGRERSAAQEITDEVMKLMHVENFAALKQVPAEELLAASEKLMDSGKYEGLVFCGTDDGYVLDGSAEDMVKRGMLARIPYMIGSTKDDLFIPEGTDYKEGLLYQLAEDYAVRLGAMSYPPVYVYEFIHDLPGDGARAFHSSELWYMFGTLSRCWRPLEERDWQLSGKMVDAWTNFMKTGDPNGGMQKGWEPYTQEKPYVENFA